MIKKLLCISFLLFSLEANADEVVLAAGGNNVLTIGVLGPNTLAVQPNGTDVRFGVSDTSMQMHYDNIILGRDNYGTGSIGGDITFKLKNPGFSDAPVADIGYGSTSPWDWDFIAGGPNVYNDIKFFTHDSGGFDTLRMTIGHGASNSPVTIPNLVVTNCTGCGSGSPTEISNNANTYLATGGSPQFGMGSLNNPAGIGTLLSVYDTSSAGFTFANASQNWSQFIITGYSNSFGMWNGSSYSAMWYPNGHLNIHGTSDDGVNDLQVTGTAAISGDRILIETSHTPASSSEACVKGAEVWDTNYEYRCVSLNTWKRTALSSF